MLRQVEVEAKTKNDALKKASEILKFSESKINLEIIKEKKGFLGVGASTTFLATVMIDLVDEGKEYLTGIINTLNVESKMEIRKISETEISFRVQTSENALLIGKDGRTLYAFQTLLRNYLSSLVDTQIIVTLDIGNYHDNRIKQLEILATKTAKNVVRNRVAIKLDPMNAFDRRVIHEKLSEWRDVETVSEGQGEDRSIVIKPKKN